MKNYSPVLIWGRTKVLEYHVQANEINRFVVASNSASSFSCWIFFLNCWLVLFLFDTPIYLHLFGFLLLFFILYGICARYFSLVLLDLFIIRVVIAISSFKLMWKTLNFSVFDWGWGQGIKVWKFKSSKEGWGVILGWVGGALG